MNTSYFVDSEIYLIEGFGSLTFLFMVVHGVEYAFGAHEHSRTGIFEVEPKQCPGFTFRKSMLIGRSDLGPKEVSAFMETLAEEYSGNTYNLITKNCNHFCNDVCLRLTGKPIPRWVNRLARLELCHKDHITEAKVYEEVQKTLLAYMCPSIVFSLQVFVLALGSFCNCVLPVGLNETKVQHVRAEDRTFEKKKLRSHSSRFLSTSNPHQSTRASGSTTRSRGHRSEHSLFLSCSSTP